MRGSLRIDPPGKDRQTDESPGSDLPLRVAYAKAFNFGEAPMIADALLSRREGIGVANLPEIQVGNLALRVIGPFLWGAPLVIDSKLADILERDSPRDLRATVAARTAALHDELRGREWPPDVLMLSNGIGILRQW